MAQPLDDVVQPPDHFRQALRWHWPHIAGRPDIAVSYTHLRAHETVLDLVCRLLLEKKKNHDLAVIDRIFCILQITVPLPYEASDILHHAQTM